MTEAPKAIPGPAGPPLPRRPARGLPGPRSRWNATKDLTFELLRPDLVVEAAYEHLQGARLRHTAQFRRWRPDRDARSCTYDQLDAVVPMELAEVFGASKRSGAGGYRERHEWRREVISQLSR